MNIVLKSIALIAPLVVSSLVPNVAKASDSDGNFALRGYGGRLCRNYIFESAEPNQADRYGSWLMGYATAYNRHQTKHFDALPYPDGAGLFEVVSAICTDQKDITFEAAAHEALQSLAPLRQQRPSAILTVESGSRSLKIRQDALQLLQQRLKDLKFYSGPINGQWSSPLSESVRNFQAKQKIEVSGLPDLATLIRAIVL